MEVLGEEQAMSCVLLVVAKLVLGTIAIVAAAVIAGGLAGMVVWAGFKLYDWIKSQ